MATFQEVQDNFDDVVPGAAVHADTFLAVVQKRCNEAGIGLTIHPVQPNRKQDRVVMQGSVTFGNAWRGKRPYVLQVYADPVGQMLQVGWQIITSELGGILGATQFGQSVAARQTEIHNDPNTLRQLNGILQAFHRSVFLPTLQDVVDATEKTQRGKGFAGV